MKRLLMALVLYVVFSLPSFAQANAQRRFEINWNVLSYSRLGDTDFGGGTLGLTLHATERLGIVAEVGVHELADFGPNLELTTYRFGPRYSRRHGKRLTMFAEVLAGGARATNKVTLFSLGPSTTTTTTSVNGSAFGAGGGVDIGIRPWIAFRAVEAEYSFVRLNGSNNNGVRIGIGVVFRFGK